MLAGLQATKYLTRKKKKVEGTKEKESDFKRTHWGIQNNQITPGQLQVLLYSLLLPHKFGNRTSIFFLLQSPINCHRKASKLSRLCWQFSRLIILLKTHNIDITQYKDISLSSGILHYKTHCSIIKYPEHLWRCLQLNLANLCSGLVGWRFTWNYMRSPNSINLKEW